MRTGYETFQPIPADERAAFVVTTDFDIDSVLR